MVRRGAEPSAPAPAHPRIAALVVVGGVFLLVVLLALASTLR